MMANTTEFSLLRDHLSHIIEKIQVVSARRGTSLKSTVGYQKFSTDDSEDVTPYNDASRIYKQTSCESQNIEDSLDLKLQVESDSESKVTPDLDGLAYSAEKHDDSSTENNEEEKSNDTITEWQAGWNVTNAIQGMFIVSFPYAVHQGGYWAIFAMIIVAYICCHTGKILVKCLYERGEDGNYIRVRNSYADIAEVVFGKKLGRPLVNAAQVVELLMTCILYVLLCGDLLQGSFPTESMPLSAWISLSTLPLLLCAFLKTMRRVSWLSLWCSVAHMLINIIIIIYCFTLIRQWQPQAVSITPDIWTVPISLGIIVFSYTSQIFLPTLEGKLVDRSRFHCMMHWTHIAAAVFKALFSYIGYITWGEDTQEVITNNLPTALKIVVNIILVFKALFSYPLPYYAAVEILETSFFQSQEVTLFPSCYKSNQSITWWGVALRLVLVVFTMLMAIFIPHFAILMGLIGSFTGTMLSFVWPCVFHLYLRRQEMRWWEKAGDVIIILLGILCGVLGIYYSSSALIKAFRVDSTVMVRYHNATLSGDAAANGTTQSVYGFE